MLRILSKEIPFDYSSNAFHESIVKKSRHVKKYQILLRLKICIYFGYKMKILPKDFLLYKERKKKH